MQTSLFQSKTLRGLLLAFFVLLLGIPLIFVYNLIEERQERGRTVEHEISNQWSAMQQVGNLLLQVPYTMPGSKVIEYAYVTPVKLHIQAEIFPEYRKKGIYKVAVYSSKIHVTGSTDLLRMPADTRKYQLDKAKLLLSISDLKGLEEQVELLVNKQKVKLKNSKDPGYLEAPLSIAENTLDFSYTLALRGSKSLRFLPLASTSDVAIKGKWESPSFIGAFLPSYTLNQNHFHAKWKVLELNRSIPTVLDTPLPENWKNYEFGLDLLNTHSNYQKNERAVKYGLLLIALTFFGFYFIELLAAKHVQFIQYGLIGIALVVFYLLLLSFSELLVFNWAYAISALSTIALLFFFAMGLTRSRFLASAISGLIAVLYTFIFIIIQLEDVALLAGSIGLFVILAVAMYASLRVKWDRA